MSTNSTREIQIPLRSRSGDDSSVSGLLVRPPNAWLMYVLAHGAGAGMQHRLMEQHAQEFSRHGIATLRYQFPYMEAGRRRPDWPNVLMKTVRAAVSVAGELEPDLPIIAGGRSMGGRMTSNAAAKEPLSGVVGLAFLGFPLHPPKKPGTERADHLASVDLPMLFLQGTRDKLAQLDLLKPVCSNFEHATLEIIEGADHSFSVLKRSGRTDEDVQREISSVLVRWARRLI